MKFLNQPQEFDPEVAHLVLNKVGITFGKVESAKIVGGKARLKSLIIQGLIRVEKNSPAANAKWRFPAGDVIRYAKL